MKMILNRLWAFAIVVFSQCHRTVTATSTTEGVNKNELKIICHYHLHTWYAPDSRSYSPNVIDESQCTHIVYTDRVGFTELTVTNRILHDGKKFFYGQVPVYRKKEVNVSIRFFKFDAYEFVRRSNDSARITFVASLVDFMDRNHFNGFDFYWGCRSCSTRDVNQDEDFIGFVRQLSEAFKPRGWLLSSFASLSQETVHPGFDVLTLSEYVDWMTVISVNLSRNTTLHLYPLFSPREDPHQETSLNWTVHYLIEKGVPSSKLVLPVSTIGRSFQLTSAEVNGLNAPASFGYEEHFNEICSQVLNSNWTVVHDSDKRVESYTFHSTTWITYYDVEDVQRSGEYIIENKLGGGSIMNLNYDDFEGQCNCGKSPLLKALVQVLRKVEGPKMENCT